MDKVSSVLVGVDFTKGSATALSQARRIADWGNASLQALHVIDTIVMIDLQEALSPLQRDIHKHLIDDAQREWSRFSASIPGAATIKFQVQIGSPVSLMMESITKNAADMLVLGIRGISKSSDGTGVMAAACVRRSPVKVLLVRDDHPGPFQKVMVGVDFSPTSLAALEAAARIAVQDSAELHVVHVYQSPWSTLHYFTAPPDAGAMQQYTKLLRSRLEAFTSSLGHEGAYLKPVLHLVENQSDGRGMTAAAQEHNADLLVMGTHGRTNLAEVLLGGTAERILRHAPCSLLTVRRAKS